jgi:hypothetical protein
MRIAQLFADEFSLAHRGEVDQALAVGRGELAGFLIEDAERTDNRVFFVVEGLSRIESEVRAGLDQGMLVGSGIIASIFDDGQLTVLNRQ